MHCMYTPSETEHWRILGADIIPFASSNMWKTAKMVHAEHNAIKKSYRVYYITIQVSKRIISYHREEQHICN